MSYSFDLTPGIVKHLQSIERVREPIRLTSLLPAAAEVLRFQVSIRSRHYSTAIGRNCRLRQGERLIEWSDVFELIEEDG